MPRLQELSDQIITILLASGRPACVQKAKLIVSDLSQFQKLHLRSLNLTESEITQIADCIDPTESEPNLIKSISFSFNPLMGNDGAIALIRHLPQTVVEVGLVGCGIGDQGGEALLKWIGKSPSLRMLCVEQNQFSPAMLKHFKQLSMQIPNLFLMV